jgi:hypothetical protein
MLDQVTAEEEDRGTVPKVVVASAVEAGDDDGEAPPPDAAADNAPDGAASVPTPRQQPRPRCAKLLCCDPGDDAKAARKIFRVMDVEEETIVSWAEFYLFVRHSCVSCLPARPLQLRVSLCALVSGIEDGGGAHPTGALLRLRCAGTRTILLWWGPTLPRRPTQ